MLLASIVEGHSFSFILFQDYNKIQFVLCVILYCNVKEAMIKFRMPSEGNGTKSLRTTALVNESVEQTSK